MVFTNTERNFLLPCSFMVCKINVMCNLISIGRHLRNISHTTIVGISFNCFKHLSLRFLRVLRIPRILFMPEHNSQFHLCS